MSVSFMDENPVQIQTWYKYLQGVCGGVCVFAHTYVYVALCVGVCMCMHVHVYCRTYFN